MINSRLYKLRQEYVDDLQSRLEEEYSCAKCSKKEVKFFIFKDKRTWDMEALCSCGHKETYFGRAGFRGYVIAQYKFILKLKNPGIKIKFFKETISVTPPPKKQVKEVDKSTPQQHFFKGKKPLTESGITSKDLEDTKK